MPSGKVAVEKSFSTLVREIDENLRLTLRSQEALGTAACSPAKGTFKRTNSASPTTKEDAEQTSSSHNSENSPGTANAPQDQPWGIRKFSRASQGNAVMSNATAQRNSGRVQTVSISLCLHSKE
jgi:hypothetical protein